VRRCWRPSDREIPHHRELSRRFAKNRARTAPRAALRNSNNTTHFAHLATRRRRLAPVMLLHETAVIERSHAAITEDPMNTQAQETTAHLQVVRSERSRTPFKPPRYAYGFADLSDAKRISALRNDWSLEMVRASLAQGNDEWIVARQGNEIVAAVHVHAEEPWQSYRAGSPTVAEHHTRCGLERYLTHLADLWIQSINLPAAA
jgi:hypothetical protein